MLADEKETREQLSVRVKSRLKRRLKIAAAERGVTVQELVEGAVERVLLEPVGATKPILVRETQSPELVREAKRPELAKEWQLFPKEKQVARKKK